MRSIQRDFAKKILLSRICFLFIKCQSSLTPVRLQPDVQFLQEVPTRKVLFLKWDFLSPEVIRKSHLKNYVLFVLSLRYLSFGVYEACVPRAKLGCHKSIRLRNIAKGTTDPRVQCSYQSNFFWSFHKFLQNLDQISSSKSRPSINFKISTKHHLD